jgi:NAD(P)-dependent dehydrogenase (short-subunit alcohol dehydrogenase family)
MEWLININFWGVVHGTRAFLPHLRKAARGAYRQPLLDLRHHRPARPDRVLRGEIRGARLFGKPAA